MTFDNKRQMNKETNYDENTYKLNRFAVKQGYLLNKFSCGKSSLKNKFHEIYSKDKTEWEIMQDAGFDRIFDCGKFKYKLVI